MVQESACSVCGEAAGRVNGMINEERLDNDFHLRQNGLELRRSVVGLTRR